MPVRGGCRRLVYAGDVSVQDAPADSVVPGRRWRSALAVAVVLGTLVGSGFLTDDSWPFAPFRMFSVAVRPNGRVVKVDFVGTTRGGREVVLDAAAFGLRRAEVEGQQGPGGRLTDAQLAALARVYNDRHRSDPLVRLDFRRIGRELVDGRPGDPIEQVLQTWPPGQGEP